MIQGRKKGCVVARMRRKVSPRGVFNHSKNPQECHAHLSHSSNIPSPTKAAHPDDIKTPGGRGKRLRTMRKKFSSHCKGLRRLHSSTMDSSSLSKKMNVSASRYATCTRRSSRAGALTFCKNRKDWKKRKLTRGARARVL